MKSQYVLIIFLFTLIFVISSPTNFVSASTKSSSIKFIKTTCNTTTYPSLCYKTLSPYTSIIKTSPLKLSFTSLSITIKAARDSSTLISTLSKQRTITKYESAVIKDCIENLQDSISEFNRVRKAMSSLSGPDREFQMSNAKTWASAALTDEDTCLDGFTGRKVSPAIKIKIQSTIRTVEKLTSISLALINHLKY